MADVDTTSTWMQRELTVIVSPQPFPSQHFLVIDDFQKLKFTVVV